MRAAVYYGRRDVRVEDVPDPEGPSAGEVLVAPILCGICGTDVHEFTHGPIVTPVDPHPLTGATNPQILGHEFCAEVLEVGDDVTHVRAGQRVSAMPLLFCGTCHYCRLGHNHLCERMGCTGLSYAWGGLAEAAIVHANQLTVLPDEIDNVQGALIEPIAVAAYGVDRGGVVPGTSVLVTGGGPIGILSAEYAIARGATTVVLTEPNPHRRAVAESLGLTTVLDPTDVDVVAEVQELTEGRGVDVSIECSGAGPALDACIKATRSRGTVAQTGLHVAPATIDAFELALREITLVGTWCYPVTDFPRIIALLASGKMNGSSAVTATVGLDETVEGFERLIDPTGGDVKILIDPKSA